MPHQDDNHIHTEFQGAYTARAGYKKCAICLETYQDDVELRRELLEHFVEDAPSYKDANEYQQALAKLKADKITPLITQYTEQKVLEGRKDEATLAARAWNDSRSTEAFADEMNNRIEALNKEINNYE